MFGSTIINQRQHVGLQQLSALSGVTHSSLGPGKRYKFIQDETSGESSLVCSCYRLLENLELTCAVGQLVNETIQAHQKVYNSGSGCLLFLAGAWSRAALECLQRGISMPHIISAMSEGMDGCLEVCRKNSISIQGLGAVPSENCTATSQGLQLDLPKKPVVGTLEVSSRLQGTTGVSQNNSRQWKIKLTHSRHFCEAKRESVSAVPLRHSQDSKHVDIAHIAGAVSHGCDNAMSLVVEVSRMQSKNNEQDASCSTFNISEVVTCALPGLSEEHACVLPGCIVLLSAEQASVAQHLKEQHLKVALINGDLSVAYRHLGFNRPTGVRHVTDKLDLGSLSKEEEWVEIALTALLKLNVNLILVSGVASEKLIWHCFRHHILVVEKMKVSVLKAFANATGAVPVTYATQLSEHCVGTGAQVAIWRCLDSHERASPIAVNISTNGNTRLVTVVLTSCVHSKLQALEDQFWGCAYRLHHALKDGALLPGAGVTERLCIRHLQQQAEHHVKREKNVQETTAGRAGNPYTDVVLHLMMDGLMDYISTIMVNTGTYSKVKVWTTVSQQLQDADGVLGISANCSNLSLDGETGDSAISSDMKSSEASALKVYDNLSVKLEVWRKALDLVFLVLQTDAEVITGIDHKNIAAQENLILL